MKKNKKKIILFCIAFFLIFAIFTGYYLITWGNNIEVVKINDTNQVTNKIQAVIKSDGNIDFSEMDLNTLIQINIKNINKNIEEVYARIKNNRVYVYIKFQYKGINVFTEAKINPLIEGDNITLNIEEIRIGKIKLPNFILKYVLSKDLPKETKVNGNKILLSKNVLFFNITSLSINNNLLKLSLKTEPTPVQTVSDANTNSNQTSISQSSESDKKIVLLKNTNRELYNVKNIVKSDASKSWISNVININAKMISNPNGNYNSEINNAKSAYNNLQQSDRDDIKSTVLFNMDTSAVRFLASSYGLIK